MATVKAPPAGQQLVLYGVDWQTYTRLLHIFVERRLRLTYDRGTLEIMTVSHEHESQSRFLSRLILTLTEELGLPVKEGGSTTFRRRLRRRGLEPDGCCWISNEPLVRGKRHINLRTDPPPDLAIEMDVSRSSLNRLAIYAALGFPEVWRFDGQTLTFYVLGANGQYAVSSHSRAIPWLVPADLVGFLALPAQSDENAVIRQFRAWVRQQVTSGRAAPPAPPTP
jgi:Uma2 family endonuclease